MLSATIKAIEEVADFQKQPDGSWRAELKGAVHVLVEGRTLSDCRHRLFDAVDERVAAWLLANSAGGRTSAPLPETAVRPSQV